MNAPKEALDNTRLRELKAAAHHLNPVVMIGAAGLTPAVLKEIDTALLAHELIKVRLGGDDRTIREAMIEAICNDTGSELVQSIGKVAVFYRKKPEPKPSGEHVNKQKAAEQAIRSRAKSSRR